MKPIIFAGLFCISPLILADDIPSGHPTIRDALDAAGAPEVESAELLPNQGVVLDTLHSRGYTYIQVEQDGKKSWLAAPRVELEEGSLIRYGQGITMANFYSNGLKREFAEIFFVDKVMPVDK